MAYYYDKLNVGSVDLLIENTGRISHVIRNLTQGYVTIDYPEILTLDNIAGQIEAQCRAIRGNLKERIDIKSNIFTTAKLARFMKNIISVEFYKKDTIDAVRLGNARKWVDSIISHITTVDNCVNKSILSSSQDLFSMIEFSDVVPSPGGDAQPDIDKADIEIAKEFDYEKNFDEKQVDVDKNVDKYRLILANLGSYMANLSHFIQDEVSDWINTSPENTVANQVINTAGQIENAGRQIIEQATVKILNQGNTNKSIENANANVNTLKDFVKDKKFPQDNIKRLLDHARIIQERVIVQIKKLIQKGYSNLKI